MDDPLCSRAEYSPPTELRRRCELTQAVASFVSTKDEQCRDGRAQPNSNPEADKALQLNASRSADKRFFGTAQALVTTTHRCAVRMFASPGHAATPKWD
jgi:hypothetical protein